MDCVIPGHHVRAFSHAVGCLCRVGKELYLDFDPLDGLSLRTLNDAKSAYCSFSFDPGFFERCSSPPTPGTGQGGRKKKKRRHGRGRGGDDDDDESQGRSESESQSQRERYGVRVPLRTMHSALRSRGRGGQTVVRSLRIRSAGGTMTPLNARRRRRRGRGRVDPDDGAGDSDAREENPAAMQLCLEFKLESCGALMRIVHRIGVAECDATVSAATNRENCSEIVTSPAVVTRMLDPLGRSGSGGGSGGGGGGTGGGGGGGGTPEVALTVSDPVKVATVSSFHHADAAAAAAAATSSGGNGGNALLAAGRGSVLKTETSVGCDEFDEYHWRGERRVSSSATGVGSDDDERDEDDTDSAPDGVNEEVSLVFSIKEVKAMLQFCSQATPDEDLRVVIYFEWGGRPILFESEGENFSASLVMATLDHRLLRGGAGVGVGAGAATGGSGGGGSGGSGGRN